MANGVSSNTFDVLNYCMHRLDVPVMDAIIKANRSGLNTPGLEGNLQRGEYIPVLSALWGEKDKERRVEWLRANAYLHPPLMFERAIAEFVAAPTVETVVRVVIPLMNTATFRIYQDASCLNDSGAKASFLEDKMSIIYLTLLTKAKMKYAKDLDLEKIIENCQEKIDFNTSKALAYIAYITMNQPGQLPTPVWVSYHNGGSKYPMIPPGDFTAVRQEVVRQKLLRNPESVRDF